MDRHVSAVLQKLGVTNRGAGQMNFYVVVTEFRDLDGVLVAEARGTFIERAAAAGGKS